MTLDIQATLREIADGIRTDIFKAYEAINLLNVIGASASYINDSGFGIFFGKIQNILNEQIVLSVAKAFEEPDTAKKFPLNSIPAAITFITKNTQTFTQIEVKDEFTVVLLKKIGCKAIKKNCSATESLCKYWGNHIGEIKSIRQKIKRLRDKIAAHHERVDVSSIPDVSLSETMELLKRAENFLSIIDYVYLDLISVDYEGNYFVNSEAERASLILRNLLVKANIIDIKKGGEIVKKLFG